MVMHRGLAVRQHIGGSADLIGPAVNVAHRLLKNTVRERLGHRPYILLTQAAAAGLGEADRGLAHQETYADVGQIDVRIIDLADAAGVEFRHWPAPPVDSERLAADNHLAVVEPSVRVPL